MRLENMSAAHVQRAFDVYLSHAWPEGVPETTRELLRRTKEVIDLSKLFGLFENVQCGDGGLHRYVLRLGNSRYPFMKFVVQEHLVTEEYFFSVDSHDNLEIRPENPDFQQWEQLKEFNRELKQTIESSWEKVGLPTNADLNALCQELAQLECEDTKRRTILLVDDETELAVGLASLLRARGYGAEIVSDGLAALQRLGRDPLPDLVLLDYEMPQLDGEEVLRRLRRDPRTSNLPVLLATASQIDLSRLRRVSGLLRKPYPRHVLFEMIERLLCSDEDETA